MRRQQGPPPDEKAERPSWSRGIFHPWPAGVMSENNNKSSKRIGHIALVDDNKILLVDTDSLNKFRILHFWDQVANFDIFFRQVDGDNFVLRCVQVGLDV